MVLLEQQQRPEAREDRGGEATAVVFALPQQAEVTLPGARRHRARLKACHCDEAVPQPIGEGCGRTRANAHAQLTRMCTTHARTDAQTHMHNSRACALLTHARMHGRANAHA
eukprot:366059-Chlamydomonas_euryale.AAC.3